MILFNYSLATLQKIKTTSYATELCTQIKNLLYGNN